MAKASKSHAGDITIEVVEKVAKVEGVNPLNLTPRLYEAIDPDALSKLFANTSTANRMDGQVIFAYNECKVTVYADGCVSVDKSKK